MNVIKTLSTAKSCFTVHGICFCVTPIDKIEQERNADGVENTQSFGCIISAVLTASYFHLLVSSFDEFHLYFAICLTECNKHGGISQANNNTIDKGSTTMVSRKLVDFIFYALKIYIQPFYFIITYVCHYHYQDKKKIVGTIV